MREPGELALHPHELARVLERLLLGLRDVTALQVTAILRTTLVARLGGDLVVELPDLLGRVDGRAQRDVRIALLRRPDDGLLAEDPGNPDARMRLLERQRPRVHDAVLEVRALPPERPVLGPRLHDELVRLLEPLAVVGWIDAGRQLLL